ncbi:hypothetical protein AGMMS50268_34760 [Spirochaetia bacterium]|nr:hypothetical protein AGMMS50268_34760 [Spirochaetia bacterium]
MRKNDNHEVEEVEKGILYFFYFFDFAVKYIVRSNLWQYYTQSRHGCTTTR